MSKGAVCHDRSVAVDGMRLYRDALSCRAISIGIGCRDRRIHRRSLPAAGCSAENKSTYSRGHGKPIRPGRGGGRNSVRQSELNLVRVLADEADRWADQ
jgi:hypothetical protein